MKANEEPDDDAKGFWKINSQSNQWWIFKEYLLEQLERSLYKTISER